MSGSLPSALDLTRTRHLGQEDSGREEPITLWCRAVDDRRRVAGEGSDLLSNGFSKRAFSALGVAIMRPERSAHWERRLAGGPFPPAA